MILAFHLIFSAYGFWLPNDPRGSWSNWVGSWDLFKYGPATKTDERYSVAHAAHDTTLRFEAKNALTHPPVIFDGKQARSIAMGFAEAASEGNYPVWACAILPDHVHMVIGNIERKITLARSHLKAKAAHRLNHDGLHPFRRPGETAANHSIWSRNGWTVFIDREADLKRAIEYVEANPLKEGLPAQKWRFVKRLGER